MTARPFHPSYGETLVRHLYAYGGRKAAQSYARWSQGAMLAREMATGVIAGMQAEENDAG